MKFQWVKFYFDFSFIFKDVVTKASFFLLLKAFISLSFEENSVISFFFELIVCLLVTIDCKIVYCSHSQHLIEPTVETTSGSASSSGFYLFSLDSTHHFYIHPYDFPRTTCDWIRGMEKEHSDFSLNKKQARTCH